MCIFIYTEYFYLVRSILLPILPAPAARSIVCPIYHRSVTIYIYTLHGRFFTMYIGTDLYIGWICLWSTLVPKPTNLSSFNQTREAYQGTLPGPKNKAKTLRESKKGARLLQAKNLLLVPFVLEASANAFLRLAGAIPNGTSVLPAFPSGPGGWLV